MLRILNRHSLPFLIGALTLIAALNLGSCGGQNITFPQGPTSGAGDLAAGVAQVSIQPFGSFDLTASFDSITHTLHFAWHSPAHLNCARYRVVITPTPAFPQNGLNQVTVVWVVGETTDFTFDGSASLTDFVSGNSGDLSAVVLCLTEPEIIPFPRSDFESVTDLVP